MKRHNTYMENDDNAPAASKKLYKRPQDLDGK